MKKQLTQVLAYGILLVCSACASSKIDSPKAPVVLSDSISVDLFSARGSMGKSEYERYRLDGDLLWRECGTIEKNAEDIPNEGRVAVSQVGKVWLVTKEKDAQVVSNDRLNTLREKISGVLQQFRTVDDAPKLPSPEAYDRFAGAGLFELKVVDGDSQTIVLTSLDAVAERTPKPLTSVHELFAQLRGTESTSCRARDFFGIGRSN